MLVAEIDGRTGARDCRPMFSHAKKCQVMAHGFCNHLVESAEGMARDYSMGMYVKLDVYHVTIITGNLKHYRVIIGVKVTTCSHKTLIREIAVDPVG